MKRSIVLWVLSLAFSGSLARAQEFTQQFDLDDCRFSDRGRNAYFSLQPGDRLFLAGDDDGEELELQITVLNATKWIRFVTSEGDTLWVRTRVVEEREWMDGELVEVSRNYYARCEQTGDIYYFGEDVDIFDDGQVRHDGAWRAGVNGAQPGLIMPGSFLLGSRYYQEIAPDVALDRAEHVEEGLELELPAGTFDECVRVVETTPLEPGHESVKVYCEDVVLVQDGVAELTGFRISRQWW